MPSLTCWLWLLFLGAALAGPLYWLIRQRRGRHEAPAGAQRPQAPRPASPILYLSPACMQALWPCATPGRLRRMDAGAIARRLARGRYTVDDPMPAPGQYESWPEQARLLCAGKHEELAALQHDLKQRYGEPLPVEAIAPELPAKEAPRRTARERELTRWIALMLAFLLLSLLARLLLPCRPLDCPPPTCPDPKECPIKYTETTLELSSDMVFDYNHPEPISDAHAAKTKAYLKALLAQHDNIEIISIEGHTDPIGTTAANRKLGADRARFIRTLLGELMSADSGKRQFTQPAPPVDTFDSGPNRADFAIWSACFSQFNHKTSLRPLVSLPRARSDGRTPCDQATPDTGSDGRYPACARMPLPEPGERLASTYPQRSERLREMIACLAPMRHVEIRFKSRRFVPAAAAPTAPAPAAPPPVPAS